MRGGEFGGKTLDHADQGALAGGVIAVERLASLARGGADQHDMTGRGILAWLPLHLSDRMLHQAENAFQVDGQGAGPLVLRHAIDWD